MHLDQRLSSNSFLANSSAIFQFMSMLQQSDRNAELNRDSSDNLSIQSLPVSPYEFPVTEVMELRPYILWLPRFFIPHDGFRDIALHQFQSSFEK